MTRAAKTQAWESGESHGVHIRGEGIDVVETIDPGIGLGHDIVKVRCAQSDQGRACDQGECAAPEILLDLTTCIWIPTRKAPTPISQSPAELVAVLSDLNTTNTSPWDQLVPNAGVNRPLVPLK